MGWGTIPDDHPLMAGMVGLQTSHRYGNATFLEVRFRARHRQPLGQPPHRLDRRLHQGPQIRARRHRADPDRPRVRAGLRHRLRCRARRSKLFIEVGARDEGGRNARRIASDWAAAMPAPQEQHAAQEPLRSGAAEAAARLRGNERVPRSRHLLRHDDRPVADRGRAVPARLPAAQLDQLRPGRPAGLDACPRRSACAPPTRPQDRRAVRRLRLPVHDRGARGRRAAQAALSCIWW